MGEEHDERIIAHLELTLAPVIRNKSLRPEHEFLYTRRKS